MDDIGTLTISRHTDWKAGRDRRRITRADPRIRISREFIDTIARGGTFVWHRCTVTDGDVLTIRDDYGARFIYRIHWDDFADGGYLAEWPD